MESQFTFDFFEPFEDSQMRGCSFFDNEPFSRNSNTMEGFPFGFDHHHDVVVERQQDSPLLNPFNDDQSIFLMRNESSVGSPTTIFRSSIFMDSCATPLKLDDVTFDPFKELENQLVENISESLENEETTGKSSPAEEEKEENQSVLTRLTTKEVKSMRKKLKEKSNAAVVDQMGGVKQKTKKQRINESKNVVKNYGKAIAAFCLSEVGNPYLQKSLQHHQVQFEDFKQFVINKKETIDSIDTFRELLTPDAKYDTPTDIQSKLVFKDLSEVFIRDFALNWIFNSRIRYKETHLNLRYKMLRRVRNPQNFTYLRSF